MASSVGEKYPLLHYLPLIFLLLVLLICLIVENKSCCVLIQLVYYFLSLCFECHIFVFNVIFFIFNFFILLSDRKLCSLFISGVLSFFPDCLGVFCLFVFVLKP